MTLKRIKKSPIIALLEILKDSTLCKINTPKNEIKNPNSLFFVKSSFFKITAMIRVKTGIREVIIDALVELVNFKPFKNRYWGIVILIKDRPNRMMKVLKL